jgi:hypothetical protein
MSSQITNDSRIAVSRNVDLGQITARVWVRARENGAVAALYTSTRPSTHSKIRSTNIFLLNVSVDFIVAEC